MLEITKRINEKGEYFTLYNPKTKGHCPALTQKDVDKIKSCFKELSELGYTYKSYPRYIKMKTLRLIYNCKISSI